MTRETYTTRAGARQYRPVMSMREYENESRSLNDAGFCLACGTDVQGVEPDMRKGACESCGAAKVYGLEELLMMGLVRFEGGAR